MRRRVPVLTLVVAAACGHPSTGRPDADVVPPDSVPVDSGPAPAEVVSELCAPQGPLVQLDVMNHECPKGVRAVSVYYGLEIDRAYASAMCHDTFAPLVEEGSIRIDLSAVQACKDYVAALSCDGVLPRGLTPCSAVFDGQQQAGDTCVFDEQCPSGTYCRVKNSCGRCEPLAMELSYCTDHIQCMSGYCANQLCRTRGNVGASCQSNAGCSGSLLCAANLCTEVPSNGDDCEVALQFDGACGYPDSGLFCRTSTARCAPESLLGEPCDDYIDAPCSARDGLWCDAGVCVAPTIVGVSEPCQPPLTACDKGLICRGGTCSTLGQLGMPCSSASGAPVCEPPLVCVGNTCTIAGSAPACIAPSSGPAEPFEQVSRGAAD